MGYKALEFLKRLLATANKNLKEVHMTKYTVKIDGMACGMCEAHIRDTIARAFPSAKKVSASRKSREATFVYDGTIEESAIRKVIDVTGYTFVSLSMEQYIKHGLFG